MADTFKILDLEIDNVLVEKIRYLGKVDMYKKIEEYKKHYHLGPDDNYAFFYYKIVQSYDIAIRGDDWDWELIKQEANKNKALR